MQQWQGYKAFSFPDDTTCRISSDITTAFVFVFFSSWLPDDIVVKATVLALTRRTAYGLLQSKLEGKNLPGIDFRKYKLG